MLEAFKNNTKNHLILFGFGDLEDKIIKYTQENKNIHYFGNVENNDFTVTSFSVILDYAP